MTELWIAALAAQFVYVLYLVIKYLDSLPVPPPPPKRDWEATGLKLGRLVRGAQHQILD